MTQSKIFEVEVRGLLSLSQKKRILKLLSSQYILTNHARYRTILFRKPQHLRIRYDVSKKTAVITRKSGRLSDSARIETNRTISKTAVSAYLRSLQQSGFDACCAFYTLSKSFRCGKLLIHVSQHDGMGIILEVERLVGSKKIVQTAKQEVIAMLAQLGVRQISAAKYKVLMNQLFVRKATNLDLLPEWRAF